MRNIFLLALLCPMLTMCQPITIRGNVINEQNEPVAGATITLKRTAEKTMSAADGSFTIQASLLSDTLIISAQGYQTALEPNNERGLITIILKKAITQLQEVIINTGYQQLPKERATGSFSKIDEGLFNQQISTSILSRLEAIANGLSVNRKIGNNQIMIRGLSTIRGPKDPLIIIDNFPYEGDIANINPNDVESITILKDAAAASIWGTRAGNGVIVITTRRGRFGQPIKIEATANVSFTKAPDLFYLPQMTSSDFIDVEQLLFSKGFRFSDTAGTARLPFSPVYEILFRQRRGQLSAAEATAQIDAYRFMDVRSEFNKHFYATALARQYALNLTGGTASNAWVFSAGFDDNVNELSASYQRLNLRLQNTIRLYKNLQLTAGVYFTSSSSATGKPSYNDITTVRGKIPPYTTFARADGAAIPLYKTYRQTYIDTAGAGRLLDWKYYPLTDYQHVQGSVKLQDILGNLSLHYKILPGLSADVHYRYQRQASANRTLNGEGSFFTRDLVNTYSQINAATGAVTYRIPKGAILDLFNNTLTAQYLRGTLSFDRSFARHNIVALLGAEVNSAINANTTSRTYGYTDDILATSTVDIATSFPTYIRGTQSFIPNRNGFAQSTNRFVATFLNAAYTFDSKYTASISARRDASNMFGVATNDKWTPLWSAGLAWQLSKEAFYHSALLPFLKLRLTYGTSGNANPFITGVTTLNYGNNSPYTGTPTAVVDKFANPHLRWEQVAIFNAGIDFRFGGDRVVASIEYYHKKATDLFGTAPIDYSAGLATNALIKNVAAIKASGLDLELISTNINKAFKWLSALNLSINKDKVTDYYLPSLQGSQFVTVNSISGVQGRPVYAVFSYKWAGLDAAGNPRGYLNDTVSQNYNLITGAGTSVTDLVYNGPSFPVVFGALGNTFSYKAFSITARVIYKLGYYFKRSSINYTTLFSNNTGHADYALRWQKPGDELTTFVPSLTYPANANRDAFYSSSEVLIERGDHVRLQYVTLAYDWLPQKRKLPFQKLSFYINANDLGIIWKATSLRIDPDYRIDVIPPSKNIAFGIKAIF